MGFLNYQDNHGKVEDWGLLKLKNAKTFALYLFYITGIMALVIATLTLTKYIDPTTSQAMICLLIVMAFTTLMMGLYTLKLYLYIKFFRRK